MSVPNLPPVPKPDYEGREGFEWIAELELFNARELKAIRDCVTYLEDPYGDVAHNLKVIVAKLAMQMRGWEPGEFVPPLFFDAIDDLLRKIERDASK